MPRRRSLSTVVLLVLSSAVPASAAVDLSSDVPHPLLPASVSTFGDMPVEVGDVIPIEELVDDAARIGEDIVPELEGGAVGGPLSSVRPPGPAASAVPTALALASARHAVRPAAADPAYRRLQTWNDNQYLQVVLRQGTSTWGWTKIQSKHRATLAMAKKTTQFPRTRTVQGGSIVYTTPAMTFTCWLGWCSIDRQMTVKTVFETTRLSDGFAKGVITTHCVGVTVCPQWVRDVAG